ncbi:MAG: hypothetical protein LQ352_002018 [Teloschistes flavicans]|nr:MAG: hypothetical protein LQ352_002018 [Teloschistes flavicans]
MNKFYRLDVARHGARDFEFVGTSGIYKTKLPKMRTPRRYTVGSCTLVIAMLGVFPQMDLPDPPSTPVRLSDVSTFYDLHQAALRVHSTCVQWIHQAGYLDIGAVNSMGSFLMATDSYEERIVIPQGIVPSEKSNVEATAALNGTVPPNLADLT